MTNVTITADQWSMLAGMLSVRAAGAALKMDVSLGSPTSSADILEDLGKLTGGLSCAPDPNPGAIWTSNGSGLDLHYESVSSAEAESDLHDLKMRMTATYTIDGSSMLAPTAMTLTSQVALTMQIDAWGNDGEQRSSGGPVLHAMASATYQIAVDGGRASVQRLEQEIEPPEPPSLGGTVQAVAQACYDAALTAVAYFEDELTIALTDPAFRRHAVGSASEAGSSRKGGYSGPFEPGTSTSEDRGE